MVGDPLNIAIKGTTQEHLPVEDIVDDMVVLKDGNCAMVLQVSSVNFDLLSEREQSSLVFAYGGILNSLNFNIQILIRTKTKDISSYLKNLKNYEEKQTNPLLKDRIISYQKFIEEMVKKNDVLSKLFFIVIPFSTMELGIGAIVSSTTKKMPFEKSYILEKAKASLEPKRDHLLRLFSRIGLEIKPVKTKELIELFYSIYNEETADVQKMDNVMFNSPIITTKLEQGEKK
jgi:hypothetical protein